jgi:hypothetical protein
MINSFYGLVEMKEIRSLSTFIVNGVNEGMHEGMCAYLPKWTHSYTVHALFVEILKLMKTHATI